MFDLLAFMADHCFILFHLCSEIVLLLLFFQVDLQLLMPSLSIRWLWFYTCTYAGEVCTRPPGEVCCLTIFDNYMKLIKIIFFYLVDCVN